MKCSEVIQACTNFRLKSYLPAVLVIADSSVVEAPYQSKAIVGEIAVLPCNTTAPRPQNPPILVIWYKNGGGDPVYR